MEARALGTGQVLRTRSSEAGHTGSWAGPCPARAPIRRAWMLTVGPWAWLTLGAGLGVSRPVSTFCDGHLVRGEVHPWPRLLQGKALFPE